MPGIGVGAGAGAFAASGVAAWTPDVELAGVTNAFWAIPSSSTLFQDSALTTPADETADPIGGVDNQSSIGTSTLSQATTADKLKVAADGRIERDGTVTTQSLDLGMTLDFANGFCIAVDFEGLLSAPVFGQAPEFYALRASANALGLRVGGFTSRTVADVFTTNRKRIVITGDATNYEVFADGVSFGTYATDTAKTVYSALAIGLANAATSSVAAKYGPILLAEKDMRSVIAELDAWMEENSV